MTLTYSNPRSEATFTDWPYNGTLRTTATFRIETTQRGQRAVRVTINPKTGRPSAPKTLTYAKRAVIVDGDDGKTYIAELTMYGHICIMQSNMQYQHENIHSHSPRYPAVLALFGGAA